MPTFGGRGKRPGRPGSAGSGNQNEIFLKAPLKKDQDQTMVWVLDEHPPMVVNENNVPVDRDGNETDDTAEMVPNWFNFEQHYDPRVKRSWPCALSEDAVHCLGCEFPVDDPTDEKDIGLSIRDTSSAYVVPVVDEKGYVSLIQIGWGLWQSFCGQWLEYGTLTDAWYRIRRSKVGQKITYSTTKTDNRDKPELKVDVPDEEYVNRILGKRYLEAMERYDYNADDGDGVGDTDTVGGEGQDAESDPTAGPDTGDDGWKPNINAREAGLSELKDWLANVPEKFGGPVEFPKNVSRPVAIGLVEATQSEREMPNF